MERPFRAGDIFMLEAAKEKLDILSINQSITQVGMISNAGGSPYTVQLLY